MTNGINNYKRSKLPAGLKVPGHGSLFSSTDEDKNKSETKSIEAPQRELQWR